VVKPKSVRYLAGHENRKTTMDIYAKIKYNQPKGLVRVVNAAFNQLFSKDFKKPWNLSVSGLFFQLLIAL